MLAGAFHGVRCARVAAGKQPYLLAATKPTFQINATQAAVEQAQKERSFADGMLQQMCLITHIIVGHVEGAHSQEQRTYVDDARNPFLIVDIMWRVLRALAVGPCEWHLRSPVWQM